MRKKIKKVSIMFISIIVIVLSGLYLIPPSQEVINYQVYKSKINASQLNQKVGWYRSKDDQKEYQVTYGANHDLTLNYFDSLRKNIKSYRLNAINSNQFDVNGSLNTIEVNFSLDSITGTSELSLSTSKTDLNLYKVDSLFYNQKEIFYYNKDIKLAGLLMEPFTDKKSTLVILIHGSGISDRDSFWYMYQANYLAKKGYSVLLPDKRGCGKSEGKWDISSFDEFAEDVIAGITAVKNSSNSNYKHIGVMGLSQGSWISHLVAEKFEDVDFVIDVVGSLRTPKKQLNYEIQQEMNIGFIGSSVSWIFSKRVRNKKRLWWKKNGDFDPSPHILSANTKTLKILAEDDENVNTKKNLKLASKLIHENPNLDFTLKLFKNTSHGLMDSNTNWIKNEYLDFVVTWLDGL